MHKVHTDRIISDFPSPYDSSASPYHQLNFHPLVKSVSAENRSGTVGLKICKAVLVGDVAVGKTCLVNRFCHDAFDRDYKATIGVDFEVEKFSVLSIPFNLQLWDTAGQERFRCIAASYYRGSSIIIAVCDIMDPESLNHTKTWVDEAKKTAENPNIFLVITKKDLATEEHVALMKEEGKKMAQLIGAELWIVSSYTGENVKEFFFRAVALTFDKTVQSEIEWINNKTNIQIGSSLVDMNQTTSSSRQKSPTRSNCC
ncbi:DgyrCDS8339 [Dimorphilus gyrociliatus]|uniref:Ras-related protein Rab-36 n=1 Tax=Dimorphilus gyrociliatus TaxID=2664684 RepID=A0A7I8VW21_9ANNE|nr:DgyrCDS8339 [Dimorphilus gyrociliatus]